jgi:hypothetical protein
MKRGFCADCGSLVMINRPEMPEIACLQAGSLDDPNLFEPVPGVSDCRSDLLVSSIERMHGPKERTPIDILRDVVAAHFANRH